MRFGLSERTPQRSGFLVCMFACLPAKIIEFQWIQDNFDKGQIVIIIF